MLTQLIFSAVALLCRITAANAQEMLLLKAGTPIPMVTVSTVTSRIEAIGNSVDLMTTADVVADGVVVIPSGTVVKGWVSDSRKATILGIGGNLSISVNGIYATDGTYIPVAGANVSAYGSDKTVLAVICGMFTFFGFFIPGEQAYLPAGSNVQGIVMSNTYVSAAK